MKKSSILDMILKEKKNSSILLLETSSSPKISKE